MKSPGPRMTAALMSVFKPLVHLLMMQGIGIRPVIELLKKAAVDAAEENFGRNGKPASISMTSAKTGLTRREVRRLKDVELDCPSNSEFYGAAEADILSIWHAREEFLDSRGHPKTLEFGPGPGSFSDLVQKSVGDAAPLNYLTRLVEQDRVSVGPEDRVSLIRRDWMTADDLAKIIGGSLGPLALTMRKNWGAEPDDGLCQRTAYSVRMDPSKVDLFRRIARERIESFVEEIDDYFIGLETKESEPFFDRHGTELVRVGIGAYYYEIDR